MRRSRQRFVKRQGVRALASSLTRARSGRAEKPRKDTRGGHGSRTFNISDEDVFTTRLEKKNSCIYIIYNIITHNEFGMMTARKRE